MIHVTKQFNFAEGPLGINFVVKCIRNLLDGYVLIGFGIESRTVMKSSIKREGRKEKKEVKMGKG